MVAVLAAALLVATWLWIPGRLPGGPPPDHARLSGGSQHAASGRHHRSPDRVGRCADAARAVQPALRRAASSMAQWQVHVTAMNQLVGGAITLQQASAFWNRTRVGALRRIERFEHAWTRLHRTGVTCPGPGALSPHASGRLRACARDVQTDRRVLRTARTAIGTWRRHVHAMNMLRMGELSATAASRMWMAMWHRGQDEIDAYRAAAHRSSAQSACSR